MDTSHTPTPWAIGPANHMDRVESHIGIRSTDEDWVVCEVQNDIARLPGAANAAFIVRAANSHDELVAALFTAERFLTSRSYDAAQLAEAIKEIRVALAAAGA